MLFLRIPCLQLRDRWRMADISQNAEGYAVEGFAGLAAAKLADVQHRHQSVSRPLQRNCRSVFSPTSRRTSRTHALQPGRPGLIQLDIESSLDWLGVIAMRNTS